MAEEKLSVVVAGYQDLGVRFVRCIVCGEGLDPYGDYAELNRGYMGCMPCAVT